MQTETRLQEVLFILLQLQNVVPAFHVRELFKRGNAKGAYSAQMSQVQPA